MKNTNTTRYTFISAFYPPIRPSAFYPPIRPHFTVQSVRILPSHPSALYPPIRLHFTLSSVRPSAFHPNPLQLYSQHCTFIAACWKLNIATYAANLTEKPFFVTSIAILALLLIHNEIYNKWQQSSKVQEQKCAGFSVLTVNKNRPSSRF
jgi:hypothetical protein